MKADVTIDTVGLYCPVPIMLAAQKIKEMNRGELLEILADDSDVLKDFPIWCKNTQNKLMKVYKAENIYKLYIMKLTD